MDWRPTASLNVLRERARLLSRARSFFDSRGFWEVETPILSHDTVVDRHLDPIAVTVPPDPRDRTGPTMYLQTSPEFGMKRLLAAGADAIYQITRAFRLGERGRLHNPEFTMLEWYRVGDDYLAGMSLLAELACELLDCSTVEGLTYQHAFQRHAGVDPHGANAAELAEAARRHGITVPKSMNVDDRDAWLDLLLVSVVEPNLGISFPTILYEYPATQAALAVVRDDISSVAERFELYVRGIELANGYHELLDAAVLRERNAANNALRAADGKPPLPADSRLLAAMDHGLPACSGVALGFDRLVMACLAQSNIASVLTFPFEIA